MIGDINFPAVYLKYLPEFRRAVDDFIAGGYYIGGPLVDQIEDEVGRYVGAAFAVGCKSGTHALQLALLAAGVGPGDEVITVANTYYATAWAVTSLGARPVFCDVRPEDGLLDPARLEGCLSERTRAVLPVHLYGVSAAMSEINDFARAHDLRVIEDCAHAFGSAYKGRSVGADSEFACLSFYPTKSFGAFGDAGMVLTHSAEHAEAMTRARYFANGDRTEFDPRALHARLDPLQAALLSIVLRHFPDMARRRRELGALYRSLLSAEVRQMPDSPEQDVTPYVFPVFVEDRDELVAFARARDIGLQVHYATNLHRLPEFGGAGAGTLPHTERHNAQVVSLPLHPSLGDEDAALVCAAVNEFVAERVRA